MNSNMEVQGKDLQMKSKAEGTHEYARRGDKVLFRTETKSSSTTKLADQPEMKEEGKSLMIADGQFVYTLNDSGGQKMAAKMKQDPVQNNVSGKSMWDYLRKDYDLKLLPDEKINGQETYVIQASPKKPKKDATERHMYWFAKDSGVVIKSVTEAKDVSNTTKVTFTLTELKLNPEIKPERFAFKAPEGVAVMDMTKAGEAGEAANAESEKESKAEAAAEQKPEESKTEQPKPSAGERKDGKKRLPLPRIKNPLK
jgi:outer membrane lipoprotein-sorting protein